MKKAGVTIMAITMLAMGITYFKDVVLSYFFGTTSTSDAFITAITIPTLIFSFFGSTISAGYIPIYNSILKEEDETKAKKFSTNLMSMLMILFSIIWILIIIFAKQVVFVLASGFTGETLDKTIYFTRVVSGVLLLSVPGAVMCAYLHLKGTFWAVAFRAIPFNLVIIIFIFIASKYSYNWLVYGFVIASIIQLLVLVPSAINKKFPFSFKIDLKDDNVKRFILMVAPIFFAIAVNDINQIVDKTMASNLGEGAISALNYAQKFNTLVSTLLVTSITTVMFPVFSRLASQNETKELNDKVIESLNWLVILVLPATFGLMFFSEDIVRLAYGRGAFDEQSILLTAGALTFYSLGMIGFGFRQTLTRVFYALNRYKIPLYNSIVAAILNVGFNLYFFYFTDMGISGLALGASISGISSTLFLLIQLKRIQKTLDLKPFLITSIKVFIASIIMTTIGLITINSLSNVSQKLALLISVGISIIVYGICIILLRIKETDDIVQLITKRIKK